MHQESQKKIQQSRNNRESIADPNQRWGARSNGGVGAVCPVLVQPGNRWSSSLAWCTSSLVHYALSDAIMTRASELVVLVSWPQFTGVGCALCSLQFAVCSLHGLLGTERFTLPCNWHRGGYTHMDSIQRTQVNRTTQRANDAGLFCL